MSNERDQRQVVVAEWAMRAFGKDHTTNVHQRALRFLEEALETYQAAGGRTDVAIELAGYVFSRPVGELSQELGGVGVTLLALANAAGLSADSAEVKEIERVLAKPIKHFTERNKKKNEAGFDVTELTNMVGKRHCDTYAHDSSVPMCLRWFLYVHRVPAIDKMLMSQNEVKEPVLFADHKGHRVRVVMASRFGDVGITTNLDAENGYQNRVAVEELTNFSDRRG